MVENTGNIEALLQEDRSFPPPDSFKEQANIQDPDIYRKANSDPEAFWEGFARELDWFQGKVFHSKNRIIGRVLMRKQNYRK